MLDRETQNTFSETELFDTARAAEYQRRAVSVRRSKRGVHAAYPAALRFFGWVLACGLLPAVGCTNGLDEAFTSGAALVGNEQDAGALDGGSEGDAGARGPCADTEFLSGETCTPWEVCSPGTFVSREGTAHRDAECDGCASGTYSDTDDADECTSWTECEPGEFVARPGTASQDQTCEVCPDGQTSTGSNAGACHPADGCPSGTFEVVPGTEEEPPQCEECEIGYFCAGGSTPARECAEGSWDHDEDPRTRCADMTTCVAGEHVIVVGSPTTDRECEPCAEGTFTLDTNMSDCAPWSECEPGSFVEAPGGETRDRVCAGCASGTYSSEANQTSCGDWTSCGLGDFVEESGSPTNDQSCAPCPDGEFSSGENAASCTPNGECPAGTEQTAPGSASAPPDCDDCEPGEYCAGSDTPAEACAVDSWDHDADPATPCVTHTQCLAGSFVETPGDTLNDTECAACPAGSFSTGVDSPTCQTWKTCAAGTYIQMAGSATSDVECSGCISGTYSSVANAESCAAWTDCQPGEYVESAGSATDDRVCELCDPGEYSAAVNAGACAALGQCAAGTVETVAGSDTAPAVCEDCAAGSYCAGGQAPEVECSADEWDDDESPATPCVPKTVCAEGEYLSDPGDTTTNRSCSACASGEYSDTENAPSCADWSDCDAGEYVATPGSSSADRVCQDCPAGRYSTAANASSCVVWATCASPSYYESQAPSATSNRQCGTCSPPEVTSYDNDPTCSIPAFQMSNDQVVMEAEHYHGKATNGSSHSWYNCSASGISGSCMELGPEWNYTWPDDGVTQFAPRVDFNVNFSSTGNFYIWIRGDNGAAPTTGGDSCWAGVDGVLTSTNHDFPDNSGTWGWAAQTITVNSSGIHTVSIWGREDGFRFDKVVVNKSSSAPSGNGPAESQQ